MISILHFSRGGHKQNPIFLLNYFSVELFNALYRRVLCRQRVNDDQLTVTSLQALAKVYKRYHAEIGQFSDMNYILQLLDRVSNRYTQYSIDYSNNRFTSFSLVFCSVCHRLCVMR